MKVIQSFFKSHVFSIINFYPPFLGAGIRIKKLNENLDLRVSMKLNSFNKNYVGTHFGGSLYSMCDPFYMLIIMKKLGKDYLVWDKEAKINFISPGRGEVIANFSVSQAEIDDILENTKTGQSYKPKFIVNVETPDGSLVAEVEKTLWIKKKTS